MSNVITSIDRRSPAERAGVRTGEKLISIGGRGVEDVLDYRFFSYDRDPLLVLEGPDGQRRSLRVEKEEAEELGLNFETYLMDQPRPCSNHCLFCFVDQMAPAAGHPSIKGTKRAQLPYGNYITLTNLTPREPAESLTCAISPSTSPSTHGPQAPAALLGSRAGGESLEYMRAFGRAGLSMNGQIVLVPGSTTAPSSSETWRIWPPGGSQALHCAGPDRYREGLARPAARGPGHRESDH